MVRWIFLIGTSLIPLAFSNSRQIVRAVNSSQNSYEIVYESSSAEAKEKPGIYVIKPDGGSTLILPGTVMGANGRTSGVIATFIMGHYSGRHEAAAVLNGTLTIFTTQSRHNKPKTFWSVGDKHTPAIDATTGVRVEIPLIQTLSDISIVETNQRQNIDGSSGELVLVSIRHKHALGKGITLALVIAEPRDREVKLQSLGSAQIIGYDFLPRIQLSRLVDSQNPFSVFSPSVLSNHAIARATDHALIQSWRKDITRFRRMLLAPEKVNSKLMTELLPRMPSHNIADGTTRITDSPSNLFLEDPFYLRQYFNPIDGSAIISTGTHAKQKKATGVQGTVDFDGNGMPLIVVYKSDDEINSAALISRAGKYWAAIALDRNLDSIGLIDLGIDAPTNGNIAFIHRTLESSHYLLISHRQAGTPRTHCIVVEQLGGSLHITRQFPVLDKELTPRELDARTVVQLDKPVNDGKPILLFDNITPFSKAKRYDTKCVKTTPYLNLNDSFRGNNKIVQNYIKPIITRNISENIEYREFDPKGALIPKTGLYVQTGEANPFLVLGRLLYRKKRMIWDSEVLKSGDGKPEVFISLLTLQSSAQADAKEFKIVGVAIPNGGYVTGNVFEFVVPAHFDHFRGAKLVLGRRKSALELSVLVFIDPAKSGKRAMDRNGGVYCRQFKLAFSCNSTPYRVIVEPATQDGNWLEKKAVPINMLKDRLMPDSDGHWYWITDPSIDTKSSQFSIRPLRNPAERLYPRRVSEQKPMRWEETFEADWGKNLGTSDWNIWGRTALENLHPEVAKALKATKDSDEISNDNQLNAFLETMADPGGPTQPSVLLVDPLIKERLIHKIYLRLVSNPNGYWSFSPAATHFYFHEPEPDSPTNRFASELQKIAMDNSPSHRGFVLADITRLIPKDTFARHLESLKRKPEASPTNGAPARDEREVEMDESEKETLSDELDDDTELPRIRGSHFLLLATGGRDVPASKVGTAEVPCKVPSLIIATPQEWRFAQTIHPEETRVFSQFQIVPDFLSSGWSVWPPSSEFASESIRNYNRMATSREEQQVFPGLEQLLLQSTDPNEPPRRIILIMPDEIKHLVERLVLSRWASDSRDLDGPWNHRNRALALFHVGRTVAGAKEGEVREVTQDTIIDNLESMRAIALKRRPVLVGRLDEVMQVGRVLNGQNLYSFSLKDPFMKTNTSVTQEATSETDQSRFPHLLWWIWCEGRQLQPHQAQKLCNGPASFNTILLGSEKDLSNLRHDTMWENKFGLHNKFEIVRLEAPSFDRRLELIQQLFERDEIRRLGYEFQLGESTGLQACRQIVSLIVNRASQIARQQKIDDTAAFIRAYVEVLRALVHDPRLRVERKIDRFFVESLFSRIFPVPIAMSSLPPEDFLHRLSNPLKAAMAMQNMGYNSPLDLKLKVIETILAQTQGSSAGRPVPSATIFFGGTSTGKTFFFETLVNYLGLKAYDPNQMDNDLAQYYTVKCRNLIDKDDLTQPDMHNITTEIQNILDFLASPRGHRAFLLFDDLHSAKSTDIFRKLIAFIESIFEAKDGYITVTHKGKLNRREIPVRNLSIFVTINPQRDKDILERFDTGGDLTGRILAALARKDHTVEDSFLARFPTIIDMSDFPSEAKTPALVKELRNAMEEDYRTSSSLVMVSPQLLARVVEGNKDANAREFLATATRRLIHIDSSLPQSPLYLATAKDNPDSLPRWDTRTDMVDSFVRANRVIRPVGRKDYETQLEWLRMVIDSFRVHVAYATLSGARRDQRLIGNSDVKNGILVPLFISATQYLAEHPHLPLSMVTVQPDDFGSLDDNEKDFLLRWISETAREEKGFFPIDFSPHSDQRLPGLATFLMSYPKENHQYNRRDVLSKTSRRVFEILKSGVAQFFRKNSVIEEPDDTLWLNTLSIQEPKELMVQSGNALNEAFVEMGALLFDPNLSEMMNQKGAPLTSFEHARLFLMATDRAILEFPWARLVTELNGRLQRASTDVSFGQREAFQQYLFRHTFSPFNPMTIDIVHQQLDSLNIKHREPKNSPTEKAGFDQRCAEIFAGETL